MNWRKWLDGFILATKGVLLVTKEKRFWYGFVPSYLFFATLIDLLAGGFAKFELMSALGFPSCLSILGDSFLAIFGIGQSFSEWLYIFVLALLQSTLIGIIVFLWDKKHKQNSANLEKAGIITGLIALGAGCPTCGTTLLTPLLGVIFSTGSIAAVGAISTVITWLAIIIAILSLKRLGEETYVVIINEKYLKKKESHEKSH